MQVFVVFLTYQYLVVEGVQNFFLPGQDALIDKQDADRLLELGIVKELDAYNKPVKNKKPKVKKVGKKNDKKLNSSNGTSAGPDKSSKSKNVSKDRRKRRRRTTRVNPKSRNKKT